MSSKSKLNPRFYSSISNWVSNWVFLEIFSGISEISLGTVALKWRGIVVSTYYHKEHFGKPIRNTWCGKHKKLTFFMFEKYLWFLRFWVEKLQILFNFFAENFWFFLGEGWRKVQSKIEYFWPKMDHICLKITVFDQKPTFFNEIGNSDRKMSVFDSKWFMVFNILG